MRLKIVHLGTVSPAAPAPAPVLEDAGISFDPALDRSQVDATTDEFRLVVAPLAFGPSKPPSYIRISAYPAGSVRPETIPDPADLAPLASVDTAVRAYGRLVITLPGLPEGQPYDALIVAAFED